jgi:hypothetical protein
MVPWNPTIVLSNQVENRSPTSESSDESILSFGGTGFVAVGDNLNMLIKDGIAMGHLFARNSMLLRPLNYHTREPRNEKKIQDAVYHLIGYIKSSKLKRISEMQRF